MATATQIIDALAEVLGKTASSVESYALFLRKKGWWAPTKRGRGAKPVSDGDAARLLLAAMSDGAPLGGWWLDCANLALLPDQRSDPVALALQDALGLEETAAFLDYLEAILGAFRDGRAKEIFALDNGPVGCLDRDIWLPGVEVSVSGPNIRAEITFWLTTAMLDRLGLKPVEQKASTPHKLMFVHQLIGWRADEAAKGHDVSSYDAAIEVLIAERSKGVRYRRSVGSTEIEAVAAVMRSDGDRS